MKHVLLVLAACAAVTTAAAQPDSYRERRCRPDPEVREALRHYCQIMRYRVERSPRLILPRVCYRAYPELPRRYPQ